MFTIVKHLDRAAEFVAMASIMAAGIVLTCFGTLQ